jgi:4-amino-4-deoxy-L-arabinose transferase-like glycosyltransferase
MNRTCSFVLLPVFVFLACVFLFVAHHRFIDGDEGLYLLASRLVLEHKVPYLDFFYPQAPLLPYAYGLWLKLFGVSWFSARSFSATLTTIIGLLIYAHVCHETQKWIAGAAAVIVFASSTLIFAWLPLAKTYSLTAVFLFSTYVIVTRLSPASSRWLVAIAGLLFGLGVDTRSYVVGLVPILLWWIFRHHETRHGISRVLWFLGGFTFGVIPCIYFFVSSPDLFLFNNLGYHAIRSDAGLIGSWRNKLHGAWKLLVGTEDNGCQFSILSALSFIVILASRLRRSAALLAFLIACILGFISILPTPLFVQYFCLCMPFLIVAAVCGTSDYATSLHAARPRRIAVLGFVASSGPSLRRYLVTGDGVIGIGGIYDAPNWTLDKVSAVSKAIDKLAAPNEEVVSLWPGYMLASKADPYPGFENNFGPIIADKLRVDERAKYHIIAVTDIADDFASHRTRIAVLGNQGYGASELARILHFNSYTAVQTIGDTSIFVYRSKQ